MIELTKIQTIYQSGLPAFVVLPFVDFAREHPKEAQLIKPQLKRIPDGDYIPNEVVALRVKKDMTLLKAWREYLSLTTNEVAEKSGIEENALAKLESGENKMNKTIRIKLAAAMGLNPEQLA